MNTLSHITKYTKCPHNDVTLSLIMSKKDCLAGASKHYVSNFLERQTQRSRKRQVKSVRIKINIMNEEIPQMEKGGHS